MGVLEAAGQPLAVAWPVKEEEEEEGGERAATAAAMAAGERAKPRSVAATGAVVVVDGLAAIRKPTQAVRPVIFSDVRDALPPLAKAVMSDAIADAPAAVVATLNATTTPGVLVSRTRRRLVYVRSVTEVTVMADTLISRYAAMAFWNDVACAGPKVDAV
jgi:hypothetical protein